MQWLIDAFVDVVANLLIDSKKIFSFILKNDTFNKTNLK